MIVQHKKNKPKIIYDYNKEYDILNAYIEKCRPCFSDEIAQGIYEHFDMMNDELIGISIENYTKRDKKVLRKVLPFKIDYKYIDNISRCEIIN